MAGSRFDMLRARDADVGLAENLTGAVLVAVLGVGFTLSFTALLFAGTAPATQATGLVMLLITGAVLGLTGGLLGSLPFALVALDGTLIAILAAATADVAAQMRGTPPDAVSATLIVGIALASVVVGATFALIGALRAGRIVRYIPYQVTAGLLGAAGWSLASGGGAIAMGHALSFGVPIGPVDLAHLAPAVLVAGALVAASAWIPHPTALPGVVVGAVLLQHVVFAGLGWTLEEQRVAGWLLAVPPKLSPMLPWLPGTLAQVHWSVLSGHAATVLALVPMAALSLLLAMTGTEAATGCDADLDRDLKATGVGTLLSVAAGGMVGTASFSRGTLLHRVGVRGWQAGALGSTVAALMPAVWPALIGIIPRSVVAGLLLYTGAVQLHQWVVRSRLRLTLSEWLMVLAVLAAAARFGLVLGVFAGLLLGCVAFAVIYSHASPIRALYRGDMAASNVDRPAFERAVLAQEADAVVVIHLQGFLFFGTASRLLETLRDGIAAARGRLRHLVLDFAHVDGIDGSALYSAERVRQMAAANRIVLALAAMPEQVAGRLARLPDVPGLEVHAFGTLDEALEWSEDRILAGRAPHVAAALADLLTAELDNPDSAAAMIALSRTEEVPAAGILMRQGEIADDLVFIESGRASVVVRFDDAREMRVRSYGPGTMIGEIGFVLGLPRTATVTADRPCRVLRFTRAAMARLEVERPAAALDVQRAIIRRLGERLVDKDQLISALVLRRARAGGEA
jgi:SulP family sulfate permease